MTVIVGAPCSSDPENTLIWYQPTNDFMQASLTKASGGYFMTDSSTWEATARQLPELTILLKGDPVLNNTYHALRGSDLNDSGEALSKDFTEFVASAEGQKIITEYGVSEHGQPMYDNTRNATQIWWQTHAD